MRTRAVFWLAVALAGCGAEKKPTKESAPAPYSEANETPDPAEEAKKKYELTEEDLRLLALPDDDPSLTPELRRKRAYARRKKTMQNPDSPQAKALEQARKQFESGQVQLPDGFGNKGQKTSPNDTGLTLHMKPGVKPVPLPPKTEKKPESEPAETKSAPEDKNAP